MKRLIPLLFLMLTCHVYAQVEPPLPPCWPKTVGGKGTFHRWNATGDGAYLGWWCPLPDGTWKRVGIVAVPGYTIKEPPGPFASISDELAAYWTLNVTGKPDPENVGWHYTKMALEEAMAKIRPADLPPPPPPTAKQWVVAPATSGFRPLYRIVNGALSAVPGSAAVGSTCDCNAAMFVRAPLTYCAPVNQAPLVTLCR